MSSLVKYFKNQFLKGPVASEKGATDKLHLDTIGVGRYGTNKDIFAPDSNLYTPEEIAQLYAQSPYVYSAVRRIAKSLSTVPLNVYRVGSGSKSPKTSGPVHGLLTFVNPNMTKSQLIEYTASWLALAGRAYWAIEPTPEGYTNQSSLSIYPLNPLYVKVIPDPDTKVNAYVYEVSGRRIYYDANSVIEFSEFSSLDYWIANSPLNSLSYDIQIERFIKKQYRNMFFNSSILDGVITVAQDLSDDEIRKLKREFREQHEGTKNAHRVLVLTEGMSYEPIAEKSGNQTTPTVLDDVMATHGMVLGVPVDLLEMNGKATKESTAMFWEYTLVPMATLIAETLTKKLAKRVANNLEIGFDFSNVYALRLHDLDRARVEIAHVNAGIKTPNEIRQERGLAPLTGPSANMTVPEWQAEVQVANRNTASQGTPAGAGSASPSLTMPGSEGGRDQSNSGEAGMLDNTAQRSLESSERFLTVEDLLEDIFVVNSKE